MHFAFPEADVAAHAHGCEMPIADLPLDRSHTAGQERSDLLLPKESVVQRLMSDDHT